MYSYLKDKTSNLFSGYFALIMATGALSISFYFFEFYFISEALIYANILFYIILWLLTILRFIWHPKKIIVDVMSHEKGPGFFTIVAGTCILGSQLVIITKLYFLASLLWLFSIVLWVIIMYTFFFSVTIRKNKPTMAEGINGAWLIAAVATQSISVLGALLSTYFLHNQNFVIFFSLSMFLLGCMLYLNIIGLIFYRFIFLEFKLESLTPPYWINMGAVAIATLAGSNLILYGKNFAFLNELIPFLKGFTLFYWITGTWWIPLLIMLMIWKYIYKKSRIEYDPQFWGLAFPLAMYTICTFKLSKAFELPFLMFIPEITIIAATLIWLIGFIGLMSKLFKEFKRRII